jgi:hypothetical protein
MHRLLPSISFCCAFALVGLLLLPTCGGPEPASVVFPPIRLEVVDRRSEPPRVVLQLPTNPAPDFKTSQQVAWRVIPLFGVAYDAATARVEVVLELDGQRTSRQIDPFRDAADAVWILRSNRKGQVVLDHVDPNDPFPVHHGRGGNRGRSSASIRGVTSLRLLLDSAPPAPSAAPSGESMEALELIVDGERRTLALEALAEIEALPVMGDSGKAPRDGWSLRTLAVHVAGTSAGWAG